MEKISAKDLARLRELAAHQMEIAHSEKNLSRIRHWAAHNDFQHAAPIVHIELNTFYDEVVPQRLACEGEEARKIEASLLDQTLNLELFDDDWVVRDYYPVYLDKYFIPFNLPVQVEHSDKSIGHHFLSQIRDLEEDADKIQPSRFGYDLEKTNRRIEFLSELFGNTLPVRMEGEGFYSCLTQDIVHIMEMEDMFVAMMDTPDEFKAMMDNLAEDYVKWFRQRESLGLLLPTTAHEPVGQGTRSFTANLPSSPKSTTGCWGFMDSQETVGISPELFSQLIFPAYQKVMATYGALSYGCCEPVHVFWESCLSTLPNLRKISISPWCDEEYMGRQLRGRNTVYHRKPSPNFIGVDPKLDEEEFRAHIRKTVQAAEGCALEFTLRDIYTIHHDEDKVRRAIQIIREEASLHIR